MKFIYFLSSLLRKFLTLGGVILVILSLAADIELECTNPIAVAITMLIAVIIIAVGAILSLIKPPTPKHAKRHCTDTSSWEETVKVTEELENKRNFQRMLREIST